MIFKSINLLNYFRKYATFATDFRAYYYNKYIFYCEIYLKILGKQGLSNF